MTLKKSKSLLLPTPTFFDDFVTRDRLNWNSISQKTNLNHRLPPVNIKENADDFIIEIAVPGMAREDLIVELTDNTLIISCQKDLKEKLHEGEKMIRQEFGFQSFRRSFLLPRSVVEESKIEAKYDKGILQLLIPKKEEAKAVPSRQIIVA